MSATRRKRLQLTPADYMDLAMFLACVSSAHKLGEGLRYARGAAEKWAEMTPRARAAITRLGLRPGLVSLGCIPEGTK
jgi:hypothetical protein